MYRAFFKLARRRLAVGLGFFFFAANVAYFFIQARATAKIPYAWTIAQIFGASSFALTIGYWTLYIANLRRQNRYFALMAQGEFRAAIALCDATIKRTVELTPYKMQLTWFAANCHVWLSEYDAALTRLASIDITVLPKVARPSFYVTRAVAHAFANRDCIKSSDDLAEAEKELTPATEVLRCEINFLAAYVADLSGDHAGAKTKFAAALALEPAFLAQRFRGWLRIVFGVRDMSLLSQPMLNFFKWSFLLHDGAPGRAEVMQLQLRGCRFKNCYTEQMEKSLS